jgi:flagellar basal body-associated protein FliL
MNLIKAIIELMKASGQMGKALTIIILAAAGVLVALGMALGLGIMLGKYAL